MADHAQHDRADFDVLVSGGTKREVKKAAKARYPDIKIKVRVGKPKREGETQLYSVPQKKKSDVKERKRGGRKVVKRIIVTTKEKVEKSTPSF